MINELKIIIYKCIIPHNIKKISQDFDYRLINANNYNDYCVSACKSGLVNILKHNKYWNNEKDIISLFEIACEYNRADIIDFLLSQNKPFNMLKGLLICCNNSKDDLVIYLLKKFPLYKENPKLISAIIYKNKINILHIIGLNFTFINSDFLYCKAIKYNKLDICKYFHSKKLPITNYCISLCNSFDRKEILNWLISIKRPTLNFPKYDYQCINSSADNLLNIKYGYSSSGKMKLWIKPKKYQDSDENFIIH